MFVIFHDVVERKMDEDNVDNAHPNVLPFQ
jgi:hypothetical protein